MTPSLSGRSGQIVVDDPEAVFHVEHVSRPGRPSWPKERVAELMRLRAEGELTGEAIAGLLGVTHDALRAKVSRLKIGAPYTKPWKWRK